MIWNLAALSFVRLFMRLGLVPEGAIIRKALSALRNDQLDVAIEAYFRAARRDFASERVQVLREILISEIHFRKKALKQREELLEKDPRLSAREREAEIDACRSANRILTEFLGRLGSGMRESGEK